MAKQLIRSATAAAANYGEARAAESRSDFIHKTRIVLKELNETGVWIGPIAEENDQLCRIFAASIRTAGGFDRIQKRTP